MMSSKPPAPGRPSVQATRYYDLLEEIAYEFPDFKVRPKESSTLMKFADAVMRLITLGRADSFMTSMSTTVGNTVYVGSSWDGRGPVSKMITLRHERVHMRQRRQLLGGGVLGLLLFGFLYYFVLPSVFAFYRTRFEKEAYAESMQAYAEYYGPEMLDAIRGDIIANFTGAKYFWMWPLGDGIEKWYDQTVDRIVADLPKP